MHLELVALLRGERETLAGLEVMFVSAHFLIGSPRMDKTDTTEQMKNGRGLALRGCQIGLNSIASSSIPQVTIRPE